MHEQIERHHEDNDFKLLAGEQLLAMTRHKLREFTQSPSAIAQIMRLTHAAHPDQIGLNGPSVASLAFDVATRTSVEPGESPLTNKPLEADNKLPTPEHLRLYEVLFGRDSMIVANELIDHYPELARATIHALAELQGIDTVVARQATRGQIVHEARDPQTDPIAMELSERMGWDWPYYGSVDATPLYVRTIAAYCRSAEEDGELLAETYTDMADQQQDIAHSLDMAVDWIIDKIARTDENPEGLLEFRQIPPADATDNDWQSGWNQVWKDSWDAYHHADGSLANHQKGIAAFEVQVIAYDALLDAADLYDNKLDDTERAYVLRQEATRLRSTILDVFWSDEKGGYFVLGADRDDNGDLRQLRVRTSNMGYALNSRLLSDGSPESERMRDQVIRQLLSAEMLNISGVRTLARDEARFRPGAYHNGSVWPTDTHNIAKGIRRLGDRVIDLPYIELDGTFHAQAKASVIANDLDRRLLNIVDTVKSFPEYVRGDNSDTPSINKQTIIVYDSKYDYKNKVEQPPQEVQAWTVAAILAIKERLGKLAQNQASS